MSKLSGKLATIRDLATALGVTRERAHQIVKSEEIKTESPCSRCGTVCTLIRKTDLARIEKARKKR